MSRTIMAFDFGTKSIGSAIGQEITGTASPLKAFKANDGIPNWDDIEKADQRMATKPTGCRPANGPSRQRFGNDYS